MASVSNVMKVDTPLFYDDFQKYQLAKSYDKLYDYFQEGNNKERELKEQQRVYNLSLKEIYNNFFTAIVNILNDLIEFIYGKDHKFNNLMEIFVKEDRLVYLGLLLVVLSLAIYFIFMSSS